MSGQRRTPGALGFPAAYAAGVASCALASVLTVVYVGGGLAREANPVMVAMIDLIGLHGAAVSRIVLVAALFWGYFAVARAAAVPVLGRLFAWVGAAIHAVDALSNLVVAASLGLAPVAALHVPTALAILAVTGVAVVGRPPPIRARGRARTGAIRQQRL